MGERKKKRRIHYLINRKFQLEYAATALVFMLLVTVVFVLTAYRLGWVPLVEKLSAVYPQGMLAPILKTLSLQLIIRFLLLTPIIIIASIYLSHKVAGPLVRVENAVRDIARGNFQVRVKIRKRDELKGLVQAINEVTESVEQMVEKNRCSIEEALETLSGLKRELQQQGQSPEILNLIDRLDRSINDAKERLSGFATKN